MNRDRIWIRIVMVSALALMVLAFAAIATGITQELQCIGVNGLYGAFQGIDQSDDEISLGSSDPVTAGYTIADSNVLKETLSFTSGPSVSGVPVFPPDHIWNVRIDSLPVDFRSEEYVGTIGSTAYLHADFGSGLYEGNPIGIPFNIVNGSQEKKNVLFKYADESDSGPYPIPNNPFIEGGSDHHMIIIDLEAKILFELYAAEKQADGSWTAGSGAVFNLSDYTLRPSGWTSADAAGLAILPGLVRYDEVNAGEINHALRFTAPSTRRAYIWPARHYASSIIDPTYPPMGQRFRLKSSVNTSGYPNQAQIVLEALKKYGMILSDNGAPWYITGAPDEQWDNDALHALHQLKGSDFEAVNCTSLIINQNSGQTLINQVITISSYRIGVFRNGVWYLDYNNDGITDNTYQFGKTADIPIAGDWDGNNISDSAVFRSSARQFIFNTAPVTRTNFGLSADIPITGDWNGDFITEIGVFRPSARQFIFNTTPITRTTFGLSTDIPITGDWNGDGNTDIGVFRSSTRQFIFNTAPVTRTTFGMSTDIPITGDWNGDGRTEIGVFRPSARQFILNTSPIIRTTFGLSTDVPITGKWD